MTLHITTNIEYLLDNEKGGLVLIHLRYVPYGSIFDLIQEYYLKSLLVDQDFFVSRLFFLKLKITFMQPLGTDRLVDVQLEVPVSILHTVSLSLIRSSFCT